MSNKDLGAATATEDRAFDDAYDRGLLIDMGCYVAAEIERIKAELAELDARMIDPIRESCAELAKERADLAALLDKQRDLYADIAADLGGP